MRWPRITLDLPNQLRRWLLFRSKYLRVFLHQIKGPDPDRATHNHPWFGVAIVLQGGYRQVVRSADGALRSERVHFFNVLDKDEYHRIVSVLPRTWTLFIGGRRFRDWGFYDSARGGHVPWRTYLNLPSTTPDLED